VNIFYSPLSLTIALAIAYNGAAGSTAEAMAIGMTLPDLTLDALNLQFNNLILSLQNCDGDLTLNIANSLWANLDFPVAEDFQQRIVDFYLADAANLPFGDPQSVELINNWVSAHTGGKITNILSGPISEETVLFLINALYFNAYWTFQFDPDSTIDYPFLLPDSSYKTVSMMRSSGRDYTYYYGDNFQVVRMPYGRNVISMYVFLPDYEYSVNEFIANLNSSDWNLWMNSFDSLEAYWGEEEVFSQFGLPKFKVEYEKTLNDALTALGMGLIFTPDADFTGLTVPPHNPWISFIKQKAFIEVNEAGTEASAATIIEFIEALTPCFIANCPFFFVIRDDRSGTILFMGKIVDPEY
jgi:serpin B